MKSPFSGGKLLVSSQKSLMFQISAQVMMMWGWLNLTDPEIIFVFGGSLTISGVAVMFPKNFICFSGFLCLNISTNFRVCLEFVDGHSIFTTGSWELDRPLVWDWPECSLDTWEAASGNESMDGCWFGKSIRWMLKDLSSWDITYLYHICFTLETLDISLISDNWQFDTTQRWIQQLRHCPKKHTHDRYLHVPWTGPLQKCLFSQTLCE